MKYKFFEMLLWLTLAVLLIAGCEKNSKIHIVNRTSYPLYANVFDKPYTIETQAYQNIHVTTKRHYPFTEEVGKYVKVCLKGETYQIWDNYLTEYVDSTYVWVEAGKTTNIYATPNRAGVKVKNLSGQKIQQIIIQKNTSNGPILDTNELELQNGEEWYKPIDYSINSNTFYVLVSIYLADGTYRVYGNPQSIYEVDEQFLVTVLPVSKD